MSTRIRLLAGSYNVRDLGGLPTTDGREVRRGLVFRSDYPAFAEDPAAVVELGLRAVVDLRRGSEAAVECVSWEDHGVGYHRCPITAHDTSSWEARYASYLTDRPETVVEAVRRVIDPDHQPVLFHCAAGKDRTGLIAALVLLVLGVSEEDVVADYTLTGDSVDAVMERLGGIDLYREMLTGLSPGTNWPHAAHMEALLAWIADHGGAAGWLLEHGLTADELDAARAHLLHDRTTG